MEAHSWKRPLERVLVPKRTPSANAVYILVGVSRGRKQRFLWVILDSKSRICFQGAPGSRPYAALGSCVLISGMDSTERMILALVITCGLCGAALAGVEYAYTGVRGPSHWGDISKEWIQCKAGHTQSPIAINSKHAEDNSRLGRLTARYNQTTCSVFSTQYVYKVFLSGAHCSLPIGPATYMLTDLHFHVPSEHMVDGVRFPLELHLVHRASATSVAVISKMFTFGKKDPLIAHVLGMKAGKNASMNLGDYLSLHGGYYRYVGSLTTPPCSEGVVWTILKERGTASPSQINKVATLLQGRNARPLQRTHNRLVYKFPS